MMISLDRFSNPLTGEGERYIPESYVHEVEKEIQCSCGCGERIWLDDEESYLESDLWEDEWIVNDPGHVTRYYRQKRNALLLGSKTHN